MRFPRATRQVVISIAGEPHWLWRAVDQNGIVLDVLVQRRRDTRAAQRLMKRLLKSAIIPPRVMITDKLRSYGAARAKMGLQVEHRQHKGLNNRAENSHQPTRRRERIMKRFKSAPPQTMANLSGLIDPRRLVFIDETWTKTNMTRLRGWAPKGERLVDKVPHGRWKTATFAALRNDRIEAPCLFDGPINGERFHAYVEQFLVPTLKPGDVVILDNLGSRKGKVVRRATATSGRPSCSCRNTRPTSIPLSRSSPSSKPCCERREREATKPYPKPALRSSLN